MLVKKAIIYNNYNLLNIFTANINENCECIKAHDIHVIKIKSQYHCPVGYAAINKESLGDRM